MRGKVSREQVRIFYLGSQGLQQSFTDMFTTHTVDASRKQNVLNLDGRFLRIVASELVLTTHQLSCRLRTKSPERKRLAFVFHVRIARKPAAFTQAFVSSEEKLK